MSWQIFKDNILRVANNPDGIPDIDTIADLYATEYDAAIKRGNDIINGVSLKQGNVDAMREVFKSALQQGLTTTSPYDLVGAMGPGVIAYWTGAQLNQYPIPKIPAVGSTQNVSVTTNVVINPGIWSPFIPSPPSPPVDFKMTQEDIAVKQAEKVIADEAAAAGDSTAAEYSSLLATEIEFSEYTSTPIPAADPERPRFVEKKIVYASDSEYTETNPSFTSGPIGQRIVQAATLDIGIMETGTKANNGAGKNYGGGKVAGVNGELPPGQYGRIDAMMKLTGLDNPAKVKASGEGYYWCAGAVTAWWKSAGLKTPPGSAGCVNWVTWGKKNGVWSTVPAVGAAVLYGNPAHHIGIVAAVVNGNIITIEGNTGGGGFNRNGCGCFKKQVNPKRISGYVLPDEKLLAK